MKPGYLCLDSKHLNITGSNLDGLYDEPYIQSIEYLGITEIAHEITLDYSVFTGLENLVISSLKPYTFPREICFLPNLEQINCSGQCLIPPEIGEMKKLYRLDVNGDCVLAMPESIAKVSTLRMLGVAYYDGPPCPMPRWICRLSKLEQLYLSLCHFTEIDSAINNLVNLKTLSLTGALSYVTEFPSLSKLKMLERLEIMGEAYSGTRKPPYCLFPKILDGIAKLHSLKSLDLSEWRSRKKSDYLVITEKGKSIPDIFDRYPELENLDLSGMNIDFLPPSVSRLPKLKKLNIDRNNISRD